MGPLPGFIIWHDSVFRPDDMEGLDGCDWVRVSHRRGAKWQHGACLPEGGLVVSHQLRGGRDQGWGDCCVQVPIYLAAGTAAQQLDASFSTNSNLEIYGLNLSESGHDMPCLASLPVEQRFHKV